LDDGHLFYQFNEGNFHNELKFIPDIGMTHFFSTS